ncbi:MAG: STAS domain-containing protein [Oscillospiraceae bacterium]|nr:STAS domain-containing protein [Oscillospiraceae bacterium]MBQ6431873.1 STAS domain-containing protein [Oscillospiraceae bacterium]
MLNINKTKENQSAIVSLEGRLDTVTAPELEKELHALRPGLTELKLDFAKLDYISSAGLRVLLSAQKVMNKQGEMTLTNVSETVMEIFEVTGFSDILTIV